MKKCDEINRLDSCFNKAKFTELLFIMLERDKAAPAGIRKWIEERIRLGLNSVGDKQLLEAEALAKSIEDSIEVFKG